MKSPTWFVGLAVLVAGAALPAGCGGDDPGGTGGGGTTSSQGGGGASSTGAGAGLPGECLASAEGATHLAAAKAALDGTRASRLAVYEAVFGLAADGTTARGGLDDIDWDPSHDSVYFTSLDPERNVPLLLSNDANAAPAGVTLSLAADTGTFRYALLGANVPSDLALSPPAPGGAGERMSGFVARLIRWLTNPSAGDGTGMNIVLAHLADTVPADGVSAWPRDGLDPASCP